MKTLNISMDRDLRLQKFDEVFDSGADVSADINLFERQHKRLSRVFSRGTRGKQVAELGISELVNTAVCPHGEIAPDARRGLELDPFDAAGSGLETFIRVLSGDTCGNHVLFSNVET